MSEALSHREPATFYREISVAALITAGTEDHSYPLAFEFEKLIRNCVPGEIVGVGQAPMVEASWAYDHHSIEFLQSLSLWAAVTGIAAPKAERRP